jgi:HD-like signal output (HDOD) protein
MAWKLPERFQRTLAAAEEEQCPLYQVEEWEYGFSHAEIGAYLLGLWGLPYAVVEAVPLHHAPNRVPHQNIDAVSAVYVADLLAHQLESISAEGAPAVNLENYQEDLVKLGVQEHIPEWLAMVKGIPALRVET